MSTLSRAHVRAIEYHLPERVETGAQVAGQFPDWHVAKIEQRTGIFGRHIAAPDECASDLAVRAAERLFASGVVTPAEIDFLLFCTETPDYLVPPTACVLQHRLSLPRTAGDGEPSLGPFVFGTGVGGRRLRPGALVALLGFGAGYSWAATLLRWK